jgi:hypothetical protein
MISQRRYACSHYTALYIDESWLMDRLVATLCATAVCSEFSKIISVVSIHQNYAQFAERFFTSAAVLRHFLSVQTPLVPQAVPPYYNSNPVPNISPLMKRATVWWSCWVPGHAVLPGKDAANAADKQASTGGAQSCDHAVCCP